MPVCELSVRANPDEQYAVGAGVQLWTWSPVSASALEASDHVETLSQQATCSQTHSVCTHILESPADITEVLKFSQEFSTEDGLAKIIGTACVLFVLAQTCPSGDESNVILVAAGIKRVRKQAAGNKSVLFFVGQAWSRAQPTSQVSRQLSLLPGAALLLSSQGEDAFEHEFGLFYVSRIFDRGLLSVLYNMEYRTMEELQEIKAKVSCGEFRVEKGHAMAMSSGHIQTQKIVIEACGWDPNALLPNSANDVLCKEPHLNTHPGAQFRLQLAPYSSLPSYQAAAAGCMLSRHVTVMTCEQVFQVLQNEYAAVQESMTMLHGRQAVDSHAEAVLSHVQTSVSAGQRWFQEHQNTISLLGILMGDKPPYSFSHSALSATEEICKDIIKGRCGGAGGEAFDDNHLVLAGQRITEISFKTGVVLDNICVTYAGGKVVRHGGNGGWGWAKGHSALFIDPQEDIVAVALEKGYLPWVGTLVKDVTLVLADRVTKKRRAWSARGEAIDVHGIEADLIEVPGKVLKCFIGRSGWYVDQISCVWHTPVMDQE